MNTKKVLLLLNIFSFFFSISVLAFNLSSHRESSENSKLSCSVIIEKESTIVDLTKKNQLQVEKSGKLNVLNKNGSDYGEFFIFYSPSIKIKNASVDYFNSRGEKIKTINLKDFSDQSAVSDYSLHEDDRLKFFIDAPTEYPYTVEYSYSYTSSNTLFLPSWYPVKNYYVNVIESNYVVKHSDNLEFNKFEQNFDSYNISIDSSYNELIFKALEIEPIQYEYYSSPLTSVIPHLKISPKTFIHEGKEGTFDDWNDVGKWIHEELLEGTEELPTEALKEINELISGISEEKEKVKKIYEYVQNHCRYISVQIGIGGWKPTEAKVVHKTGYGDCKALVNYTRALLAAADIESYYSVVYAGKQQTDIEKEFVSLQGNHAILLVPLKQDTIWLECTSSDTPAGYISGFTDDRDVLTVFPEGGKIIHTKTYEDSLNVKITEAECFLNNDGNLSSKVKSLNKGSYYGKHSFLKKLQSNEIEDFYKDFYNISDLNLVNSKFTNIKDRDIFEEQLEFSVKDYVSKMGNMTILKPYIIEERQKTKSSSSLEKNSEFYLENSENTLDILDIFSPDSTAFSELPEPVEHKYSFGSYSFSFQRISENHIRLTREFILIKGLYPAQEFKNYNALLEAIWKTDNTNILLQNL